MKLPSYPQTMTACIVLCLACAAYCPIGRVSRALAHNEQGTFRTNDCMNWCALYEDSTYDAWPTEAAMNAALPTLSEVPVYAGADSGPTFFWWWNWLQGCEPRLTTCVISGGGES